MRMDLYIVRGFAGQHYVAHVLAGSERRALIQSEALALTVLKASARTQIRGRVFDANFQDLGAFEVSAIKVDHVDRSLWFAPNDNTAASNLSLQRAATARWIVERSIINS